MTTKKPRRPRPQKAVVDRVEDGKWAVLLVGRDELEKIVHVDHLPKGARAGIWLKVRLENDEVHDIAVDEAETRAARARVGSKLELLRQRGAHFKPIDAATVQDSRDVLGNPPPPAERTDTDSTDRPEDTESTQTTASRTGAAKLLGGPVEEPAAEPPSSTATSLGATDTPDADGTIDDMDV